MRLRKADREVLAYIDSMVEGGDIRLDGHLLKAWSSFSQRLSADEMKGTSKVTGYPVRDAIKAAEGVLGRRLIVPEHPPALFYITLQKRINMSGLDGNSIKRAAEAAAEQWGGKVKFESLIRQADSLLADSTPLVKQKGGKRSEEYLEDL